MGPSLVSVSEASPEFSARAVTFAEALILYFFVAGMIQGYLLTRMYISANLQE